MQQPPPYQPPPYQPQYPPPPGGFGAPGAPLQLPPSPPQGDRLRLPMQLVIAACGLAILRTVLFTALTSIARSSGSYSLWRIMSPIQVLLSVVLGALFVGAAASIVSQRRPGHPLALVSAILSALGILFSASYLLFTGSFGVGVSVVALVHAGVAGGALIALSASLREVGKSRGCVVDPLAFSVMGLGALGFLLAIVGRLGLLGHAPHYLGLLIALAEYGALIAMAVRLMSHAPESDTLMTGVHQGAPGAYPIDAAAPPGSVALGFLAGFFGGCIGLGLVLMLAKGPATKRGAGIGFACQTVLGIGLRAAAH